MHTSQNNQSKKLNTNAANDNKPIKAIFGIVHPKLLDKYKEACDAQGVSMNTKTQEILTEYITKAAAMSALLNAVNNDERIPEKKPKPIKPAVPKCTKPVPKNRTWEPYRTEPDPDRPQKPKRVPIDYQELDYQERLAITHYNVEHSIEEHLVQYGHKISKKGHIYPATTELALLAAKYGNKPFALFCYYDFAGDVKAAVHHIMKQMVEAYCKQNYDI